MSGYIQGRTSTPLASAKSSLKSFDDGQETDIVIDAVYRASD